MDRSNNRLYRSLMVRTRKYHLPVRIVFVKNRNKKSELLYILSTDNALSEDEIIRIYGMRWNIETFFKASKSLLKLGREFQTRSYDSAVAHTAIVFARYTFLEWLRRQENDPKTYEDLFGEQNVQRLVEEKTAAASQKAEYARTNENIIRNWLMLGVFIFGFALAAILVLELIDKDKR